MRRFHTRLQLRIAVVIRRHRETLRFSQETFADHIGMHRAQYGFIERGRRDLRLSTLERVADGLEQPLWAILREVEEMSWTATSEPIDRPRGPG